MFTHTFHSCKQLNFHNKYCTNFGLVNKTQFECGIFSSDRELHFTPSSTIVAMLLCIYLNIMMLLSAFYLFLCPRGLRGRPKKKTPDEE